MKPKVQTNTLALHAEGKKFLREIRGESGSAVEYDYNGQLVLRLGQTTPGDTPAMIERKRQIAAVLAGKVPNV